MKVAPVRGIEKGGGKNQGGGGGKGRDESKEEYYCPMHCEGDKTYDAAGRCPV